MTPSPRSASRQARGERSRERILSTAVDLAACEGLDALSIGRLATLVGMSKSGLFALFGSKQDLQLAAVAFESVVFQTRVIESVENTKPGLDRLRALAGSWLSYIEDSYARGGCFFAATSSEFGRRPGAVRSALATLTSTWLEALEHEGTTAVSQGELARECDARQLVFELHAFVQEANWAARILGDERAFERARRAIETRLTLNSSAR